MIRIIALALSCVALVGCAGTMPASVAGGECRAFRDPGRVVKGATRADQRNIDVGYLEPGYAACGWPRPKQ
jgi:hypothetical protein